jgi:hypothetical protein
MNERELELICGLKELDEFMHYIRNRCEHREQTGCDAFTYCNGIHEIREKGRGIFNKDNKDLLIQDYEIRFFNNLENAKKLCSTYCDCSLNYFKLAKKYVSSVIKSLT